MKDPDLDDEAASTGWLPPIISAGRGAKSSDIRQIVFEYLSPVKPKNGECPEP